MYLSCIMYFGLLTFHKTEKKTFTLMAESKTLYTLQIEVEVPRDVRNSKFRKIQVSERLVSTIEHMHVQNGIRSAVRRSKCPLMAYLTY